MALLNTVSQQELRAMTVTLFGLTAVATQRVTDVSCNCRKTKGLQGLDGEGKGGQHHPRMLPTQQTC